MSPTSTAAAISGTRWASIKEGNKNIPIVVRLRPQDRAQLSQIENLYVYSSQENVKSSFAFGGDFEEHS